MSNDLINFQNDEFGETTVFIQNGSPWFIGKQIATKLGYKDHINALKRHVDDEDKGVAKCHPTGKHRNMTIINESGLYSLILSSKLPTAKQYKRWVTSEVLPSIHKTGSYSIQQEEPEDVLLAKAVLISDKKIKKLEQTLIEQQPKVSYYDNVLDKSNLSGIRETGIEFGLGQKKFIELANKYKLIYYSKSKKLRPYSHAVRCGYCELRQELASNGRFYQQTFFTPEGKSYFHKKYSEEPMVLS